MVDKEGIFEQRFLLSGKNDLIVYFSAVMTGLPRTFGLLALYSITLTNRS